jgi:hypothetical protein
VFAHRAMNAENGSLVGLESGGCYAGLLHAVNGECCAVPNIAGDKEAGCRLAAGGQ